ncbi:MAG: DUF2933 domain-containing protein [Candidatus Woesebacteria bacterium]
MDHSMHQSTQKATQSPLRILGICLLIALGVISAITVFRVPINTVVFVGILLACPLMHVWMMRNGGHNH